MAEVTRETGEVVTIKLVGRRHCLLKQERDAEKNESKNAQKWMETMRAKLKTK